MTVFSDTKLTSEVLGEISANGMPPAEITYVLEIKFYETGTLSMGEKNYFTIEFEWNSEMCICDFHSN